MPDAIVHLDNLYGGQFGNTAKRYICIHSDTAIMPLEIYPPDLLALCKMMNSL